MELTIKSLQDLSLIFSALIREKKLLDWEINKILNELPKFENKHGMTSDKFHVKYLNGEMGDDEEIMIWAGEYDFLLRFQEKRKSLKDLIYQCQKVMTQ